MSWILAKPPDAHTIAPDAGRVAAEIRLLTPLFQTYLDGASCEYGLVAGFDDGGRLVAFAQRAGDICHVAAVVGAVREVIAHQRTSGIILAHNHVIGDCSPSARDIDATRRIGRACALLGIRLHDHLIFAEEELFSFAGAAML